MKEQDFRITGMSCGHCVMSVKKELMKIPGVEVRDVSIGSARVSYDEHKVTVLQLQKAIEEAGYSVA